MNKTMRHMVSVTVLAIAGTAAYFSVYGLAYTFSGVFWSVVIMGGVLEAAKLVATSYIYREWDHTHWVLKTYVLAGIAALMVMTSMGIFGYLSAGYQQATLPLKQLEETVKNLTSERQTLITRRDAIDSQVDKATVRIGDINSNAVKAMKESGKLMQQAHARSKVEYDTLNSRISQIDQQIISAKEQQLKVEAHVGPIVYIASLAGATPDEATKYMILLIIFAFDPMAIALTLAYNSMIVREKQLESKQLTERVTVTPAPDNTQTDQVVVPVEGAIVDTLIEPVAIHHQPPAPEPVADVPPHTAPDEVHDVVVHTSAVDGPADEPADKPVEEELPKTAVNPTLKQLSPRTLPVGWHTDPARSNPHNSNIRELIGHWQHLQEKKRNNQPLSSEEQLEQFLIRTLLKDRGYEQYLA